MDPTELTLETLAAAQRGLFSTAQAAAAGVHDTSLRSAVRRGLLTPLRRGWYALADPDRTPEAWHVLRVRAELAGRSPDWMVTHDSALVVHRLPIRRDRLDLVHLGRPRSGGNGRSGVVSGSDRGGCALHRVPERAGRSGRCVEPGFAVVQVGLVAGAREALVVADAALAAHLVTRGDLQRAVEAYRRAPGIAAVRLAMTTADPLAESPGESRLRHVVIGLGWPVEVQPAVPAEGVAYRADLRIAGTRVLIEYDGLGKYENPTELRRERRREAALRAAGWEIVRFTVHDLDRPDLVRRRIDEALARCSRLRAD